MKVKEFIANLVKFQRAHPQNGDVEIMLKNPDGICMQFANAQHVQGMPGQNFLVLVPDEQAASFVVKELKQQ